MLIGMEHLIEGGTPLLSEFHRAHIQPASSMLLSLAPSLAEVKESLAYGVFWPVSIVLHSSKLVWHALYRTY